MADAFAIRYYRWAIADARREVAENLRLLRLVKGALAGRMLAHLEGLSSIEQIELFTALIKRFNERAVTLAGEHLGPRETDLIRGKDEAMLRPSRMEADLEKARGASGHGIAIKRRRMASLAKRKVAEVSGLLLDEGAGVYRFSRPVGEYQIVTVVSYGRPPYYCHHVRAGERTSIREWTSLLSWLGVAGQTTWDLASGGDEHDVASAIGDVCAHFIAAAPSLLEGLCT